jgi:DNA-binding beta-propeller fold protein YncE
MQKPPFPGPISLATLAILFGLSLALAGPPTGVLSGVVLNNAGAPVAAAQVSWQAADGTAPHALHSDAHGRFEMAALRPGLYDVRAAAAGKWSDWEHNILVRPGSSASITLRLVRTTPPFLTPAAHAIKGLVHEWSVPVEDSLPHDPAVDAQGHVWVTLMQANQLGRFDPDTGRWKFFSVPSQNAGPHGLAVDRQGLVWYCEAGANKLVRFDPQSEKFETFPMPSANSYVRNIARDSRGHLWLALSGANKIAMVQ